MSEPVKLLARKPHAEVCELLRELLARAERGELQAIVLLTREPEEAQTSHHCVGDWDATKALWAAETFKHRWLHEWQSGLAR